jgi:hypothetical protein
MNILKIMLSAKAKITQNNISSTSNVPGIFLKSCKNSRDNIIRIKAQA